MIAILLSVALPFLAVPAILALRRRPNARELGSMVAAIGTFLLVASALPAALSGTPLAVDLATFAPGLSIAFRADLLGLLFALVASFLWILTTIYSIGYMRSRREMGQTRYYACFASVLGATMGVALSANLFTLLVFYEILSVSTFPLVAHAGTAEAQRAGRKYLVYTLGGGAMVLAGLAIAVGLGGNADFVPGGNPALEVLTSDAARAVAFLLLAGFGVKACLVPLSGWLPTAMVAPTPVSGLLHAVAVVKAGAFGILRVTLFLFGPDLSRSLGIQPVLLAFAVATILFASLLALAQDNLKLRLAYSTIAQLGYVVLGAALLTPEAATGASFHIATHGFAKLSMFLVAGAIATATGATRVSELDGIGRRMPLTMGAFALAVFALAALPPFGPFVSKGYLTSAAEDAGLFLPVVILIISSVLNVAYFLPIVVRAFLRPAQGPRVREPFSLTMPVAAAAAGALLLGVWLALPYGPFEIAASMPSEIFGVAPRAFDPWTLAHALELAPVLAAAIAVFLVVRTRWVVPGAGAFLATCLFIGSVFGAAYDRIVTTLSNLGRLSRRSQTGDLNWNALGVAVGLALVVLWLVLEVL